MHESNWQKVETIIDQVLDLPPEKRQTFIETECGDDPKLKGEVTKLLESISDSEGWLEDPKDYKNKFYQELSDDIESISAGRSLIGKNVGPYTIEEQLGKGGMGAVYLANRSDKEFQHSVAIKIIRRGRETSSNIQRFKREQQILADLNHPGIATLHDGGITDDGFLYIIMEYVDGMPIDEYCRQSHISIDEKIKLFQQVLRAVRHAHENLVIHRDLKPGNILVNQSGNIKILDFGISKLLEEEQDTSLTQTGARLLTPRYAAPEQIKENNITTATDLYALGVIFYELLAEVPPFHFEELSRYEIERIILEAEPEAPSSRVGDNQLAKKLRGDLDAIVLKAIRKEPEQRYRFANDFLGDLKNYQKGLPVTARRDSLEYRSKKFVQRHKRGIAVATGILLLIIGFSGFYTWRIAQERNQAELQARRAEEVKDFMLSIFDRTNPELAKSLDKDLSARQLLESGIYKVNQELQEQPEIYIEMLSSISRALMNLDDYKSSNKALRLALRKNRNTNNDSLTEASLFTDLAELKLYQGKIDSANFFATKAKKIISNQKSGQATYFKEAEANNIYALTKAFEGKYDSSASYYLIADSLYKRAGYTETSEYASNLKGLGEVYSYKGDFKNSDKYLQKASKSFKDFYSGQHLNILSTESQLGQLYYKMGKHHEAQKVFSDVIKETKEILGEKNIEIAATFNRAAANFISLAKYDSAIKYSEQALNIYEKVYDKNTNTRILSSLNNLALAKNLKGETSEAIRIYREVIAKKQKVYGKDHPSVAPSIYNLAMALQSDKSYEEAYNLMQRVLEIDKKSLGEDHPYVALDYIKLGSVQRNLELYEMAGKSLKKAKSIIDSSLPEDHKRVGTYYYHLGLLSKDQQKPSQAVGHFKKALDIYKANYKPEHPDILKVQREIESLNN